MTTDIESQPTPTATLADPVATAIRCGALYGTRDLSATADVPFFAIRIGDITRMAVEADSRKKASYFATQHTLKIQRFLERSSLELFAPHAASELQSALDAGFIVPFRQKVDLLAPLPGVLFVILARRDQPIGAALLDGEVALRYWAAEKSAAKQDIIGRVQIGNALDVVSVLMSPLAGWA